MPDEKPSFHTQLGKTHSSAMIIWGAVVAIGSGIVGAINFVDSFAKKEEISDLRNYVIAENLKQQNDIDIYKKLSQQYSIEIGQVKSALTQHLEIYAGELASERVTNRAKAAQAAARARKKFREAIADGRTLEQAFYDSQDSYWPFGKDED